MSWASLVTSDPCVPLRGKGEGIFSISILGLPFVVSSVVLALFQK